MTRRLLGNEKVGAPVVLALSGAVVVLTPGGAGPPSPERLLAGVLSNPIQKGGGACPDLRARYARAGRRLRRQGANPANGR